jgi:hypothetical protein
MRVDEAKAALERAGYVIEAVEVDGRSGWAVDRGREFIGGMGDAELISLAHRHGAWPPAFERAHSAGPGR